MLKIIFNFAKIDKWFDEVVLWDIFMIEKFPFNLFQKINNSEKKKISSEAIHVFIFGKIIKT